MVPHFDTLEATGMDRKQAEAVAVVIRNGQKGLAPKADTVVLKWAVALLTAICLATFGIVVGNAGQLADVAATLAFLAP